MHYELALSLVSLTSSGWAFNFRHKLFGVDDLINLETTDITGIDCNLNARLDIRTASDNTLNIDELANLL